MRSPTVFVLRIGLGAVPADVADVRAELRGGLDPYEPELRQHGRELELSLLVPASDLWHAVLLGMSAVTDLGYPAVRLEARPSDRV